MKQRQIQRLAHFLKNIGRFILMVIMMQLCFVASVAMPTASAAALVSTMSSTSLPLETDIAPAKVAPQCRRTGGVLLEFWGNVDASLVRNLVQDQRYPNQPDEVSILGKLETSRNIDDNYGTRIRGYLCPPKSGDYTFWIASDDQGELWLSSDATVAKQALIAKIDEWTFFREWGKYQGQRSLTITLEANQAYYLEVLHKESVSDDNLSIAWKGPGISQQLIEGRYLAPYADNQPRSSTLYLPLINR